MLAFGAFLFVAALLSHAAPVAVHRRRRPAAEPLALTAMPYLAFPAGIAGVTVMALGALPSA